MIYTDSFRKISPVYNYSAYTIKCIEQYLSETGISDVLEDENASVLIPQKQLVFATFASDITAIEVLLNSGVSIEIAAFNRELLYRSKYYLTPLQIAAARGDNETLELLIKYGADVNCKDRFDVFPIHMAAEQGYHECVRILLKAGAKCCGLSYYYTSHLNPAPFYTGTTPLHIAVSKGHRLCIKELLENFSDCNAVDELGRNVLCMACELGDEDLIFMLLRNTIGIQRKFFSVPSLKSGDTPLHFAVERRMFGLIKNLLQLGSDVNCKNKNGISPMDMCVKILYSDSKLAIDLLKIFILHGCNVDIDQGNLTLLERVVRSDSIDPSREFTKFLIAFGANTWIQNKNKVDLLEDEFKKFDSDSKILRAILDSMRFPPRMFSFFQSCRYPSYNSVSKSKRQSRIQKRKLCMFKWFEKTYPALPSLKHLSRSYIRDRMQLNKVKDLQIPNKLISYLHLGAEI